MYNMFTVMFHIKIFGLSYFRN